MTRELISVCPHCGYHHSRITGVTRISENKKREPKPTAGSFTLCENCGGWCVIDKWQRLRKASASDLREIEKNDVAVKTRLAWLMAKATRSMMQ
jgi:hypothetical protein